SASGWVPSGSEGLSAPVLFKRYNDWSSGTQLQNLTPSPARVTVIYQGTGLPSLGMSETVVVPAAGSLTLYQPAEGILPDGWVGSARIVGEPGSRLAGVVRDVHASGSVAMHYVLGRPLAMTAAAPLVVKGFDGRSSSLPG